MDLKLPSAGSGFSFEDLQTKYSDFSLPLAQVVLGEDVFSSFSKGMIVDDLHIELSSGFEASVASFRIYDVFNPKTGEFRYEPLKKHVVMGNAVSIHMGYLQELAVVFVGFVSGVSFGYDPGESPYIEVTAMDVKGLMMGGAYCAQLKAKTYSAAVKEILERTGEGNLKQMGGVVDLSVSDTPDAKAPQTGNKESAVTMEMVSESDYEFVVKVAKRFNYEFFVDRGQVFFRPAKSDTSVLGQLGVRKGLKGFHIGYSITGVVGSIEARAIDPGKGELISSKSKFENDISTANKAKALVGKGGKVYVDSTIASKAEADARVASLMERMSYRLGSLEADCVGIPDLVPGRFVEIKGMGVPVDNQFYLQTVTHDFSSDSGFSTHIQGCAAKIKTQ